MTYLIAVTESGETADGRYKLVPVQPTQEMLDAHGMCDVPIGKQWLDVTGKRDYQNMLSAATIDVAGMAMKVPKHQELTATDWPFKRRYICGWSAWLAALGVR